MTESQSARGTTRRVRTNLISGLVVVAAIAVGLGSAKPSSSTAASPVDGLRGEHLPIRGGPADAPGRADGAARVGATVVDDEVPGPPLRPEHRGALGEADGVVPDGTTVFDDEVSAVANLQPALLGALRQAANDAANEGVEILVESGWRSAKYQNQLLRLAISRYGSAEEAARWVATPATSPHVSGDAVDIGPFAATTWLAEHGFAYGLCQIYRNEPWHFELRHEAIEHGCPRLYADPTRDPRMQQ